jgi:chitosanase
LLRDAGKNDPIMQQVQDAFFGNRYFQPAMAWADDNSFTLALSVLVIYDSFVHSGSILRFLRKRFPEKPPAQGGNEKAWITQYVDARQTWLATADNPELHPTVYRTQCFKREIDRANWDLSQLPINANGVNVTG